MVARELLQLVSEFVVLAVCATASSHVLAFEILQALLADLVRVEIDHLVIVATV